MENNKNQANNSKIKNATSNKNNETNPNLDNTHNQVAESQFGSNIDFTTKNKYSNENANTANDNNNTVNFQNSNSKNENINTETENNNDNTNSESEDDKSSLDLAVLNETSKISQMGMSSIASIVNRITDKNMKKDLVAMYTQYSNILFQVNQHFEKYGEIPADAPAGAKVMSAFGIKCNVMKDSSNSHIAELMIQGTQMGVIECQKILNGNLAIEQSTLQMVQTLLNFQNQNINKLNVYL